MKELTDEQYRAVGEAMVTAYMKPASTLTDAGRAAVAAVAPLLLAEPSDDEMVAANIVGGTPWKSSETGKVLLTRGHYRAAFANRLASLTTKPDPLRKALSRWVSDGDMDEAIAAVDEARKGAK